MFLMLQQGVVLVTTVKKSTSMMMTSSSDFFFSCWAFIVKFILFGCLLDRKKLKSNAPNSKVLNFLPNRKRWGEKEKNSWYQSDTSFIWLWVKKMKKRKRKRRKTEEKEGEEEAATASFGRNKNEERFRGYFFSTIWDKWQRTGSAINENKLPKYRTVQKITEHLIIQWQSQRWGFPGDEWSSWEESMALGTAEMTPGNE